MRSPLTRHLAALVVTLGLLFTSLPARAGPVATAVPPADSMAQVIQYYGPPGYYGRPRFYGRPHYYHRPYYGRRFYGYGHPRYYGRPWFHGPRYGYYGRRG